MFKLGLVAASVCMLAGCSSGGNAPATNVDISKVVTVKSSFGPDFKVADIAERAIDPKFFSSRKLPDGLTFDPPNCAKAAAGNDMPPGVQGNMAAVSAEGGGNRFVVIAIETSQALPLDAPGKDCSKVTFTGPQMRGGNEVVDAPKIDGTQTLGIREVRQMQVGGSAHAGELYDYSAQFGDYQVIVTANPLVNPDQPVAKVDTQRARDLLVKAVGAIRS